MALHVEFDLEDVRLVADRSGNTNEWIVWCHDKFHNLTGQAKWTDNQLAIVMAYSIDDDFMDNEELFQIAEDAISQFPAGLRPI